MDFWTLFLGCPSFLGAYFKNGGHLDATHSNPDTIRLSHVHYRWTLSEF
jgi:hypothetical protein